MARKEKRTSGTDRLRGLLEAGDHRAARAEARARLAEPGAAEADRAEAAAVLASLAPDRGVALAGAIGVAVAIAIAVWTVLAG